MHIFIFTTNYIVNIFLKIIKKYWNDMIRDIDILLTEDKKINQDIILGIFEKSRFKIDVANNVVRRWRRSKIRSTH